MPKKLVKSIFHLQKQCWYLKVRTGMTLGTTKGHYPAPIAAIKSIQKGAGQTRDKALVVEMQEFIKVAKTDVTKSLVGLFLNDQYIKGKSKKQAKQGDDVKKAAVLGAGIMGGGIAYQSASKDVPIIMKDIRQAGLDQGMNEAAKLTAKLVKRGKIDEARMAQVLSNIDPTLSYGEADFADVDVVVEAVVENPKVKKIVLAEVEQNVKKEPFSAQTHQPSPSRHWLKALSTQKTSAACTSSIQYIA